MPYSPFFRFAEVIVSFCSEWKINRSRTIFQSQEIDFLFRVAFAKELMTPGQLAMAMGVSKTIISRLTEQLERKKFISKERDEIDRRSYVIRVTDLGKEEIDRMYYYYMNPLYELKEKMSELRFRQLFELIEEANNILS